MQHMPLLPWKPTRSLCFVRELPAEQTGLIIPGVDLNKSPDHSPHLQGYVEAVGPAVTEPDARHHGHKRTDGRDHADVADLT